jgi:hypothetical protein
MGRTLVYRCLLGMAETKPRRRLTIQKQLTQRPVTAPRSTSTTLLRHRSFNHNLRCPESLHWRPEPTLHHSSQVLHRRNRLLHNNVCCLVYYTDAPNYYITKAPEFYTCIHAAPAYYIEAPHYYNTEALKYYTTTYAAPCHYTYVRKDYCA